jgi:hypothetical protein
MVHDEELSESFCLHRGPARARTEVVGRVRGKEPSQCRSDVFAPIATQEPRLPVLRSHGIVRRAMLSATSRQASTSRESAASADSVF